MPSAPEHTLGAKCRLAPVDRTPKDDGLPPIEAQFFYSSVIPIDDPLSSSVALSAADSRSSKNQHRPFARGDNNALEKAWLSFTGDDDRRDHDDARHNREKSGDAVRKMAEKRGKLVEVVAKKHREKHRTAGGGGGVVQTQEVALPLGDGLPTTPMPACCTELLLDVSAGLERVFCALVRRVTPELEPEMVAQDVINSMSRTRQPASTAEGAPPQSTSGSTSARHHEAPAESTQKPVDKRWSGIDAEFKGRSRSISSPTSRSSRVHSPFGSPSPRKPPPLDDGISGKPFVRVGTEDVSLSSSPANTSRFDSAEPPPAAVPSPVPESSAVQGPEAAQTLQEMEMEHAGSSPAPDDEEIPDNTMDMAVGISRLHMVSLPMLQMKPIYWSPVNDMAVVTRATWFYRDTMLPIPPIVANQLEAGFLELRPWTETWSDELRCAIDVGPAGEEKVSHRLWPEPPKPSSKRGLALPEEPVVSSDPFCAARCFRGEAAAEGSIEPIQIKEADAIDRPPPPFSSYHVIYKNEKEAFLLKPSLKPSAYYGRRSVQKIMRGVNIGIHVVRGFDRRRWDHIHRKKQPAPKAGRSGAEESHENTGSDVCPACKADKDRGQVTDLILVAHGIGQKIAERVESYHFTHAINAFRRSVNIELSNPVVQQVVREGQNGMMILPLNWRMGLSFDDGGPLKEEAAAEHAPETFGLKDIEPKTIPAVRSMISDVMFDIPFYMSHHKGKMISALVGEANRVYRLWCRNNPGFAENGRVHMIGHSLGSAMAIEVLSRQPNRVPRLNLSVPEPETSFFEFDTTNLFLVGSPAGFFLLLERGALLPRRGRTKPGADPADVNNPVIAGDAGTYGCIAVDNVYNVLAKEDPIAYLLNGAIDPHYASSLKPAHVPSASTTFLKSINDSLRGVIPGMAPPTNPLAPSSSTTSHPGGGGGGDAAYSSEESDDAARPLTTRLPSQLELEVHDFTREETAERKARLLNDNGQIDWYLRSGGGPLEIQYLNMLSAHTSYWTNGDFVRMLCVEVGRRPGRGGTLGGMRAVKAKRLPLG